MSTFEERLRNIAIVPVVTPVTPESTVSLAKALSVGGIGAIEITLRTPAALESLVAVKEAGIDIEVGVGTITSAAEMEACADIGVAFAVSPGVTPKILDAARDNNVQLLPGVSGPSDILLGLEYGLEIFKLFPAGALNGQTMLKALHGPFPDLKFCPTGGVSPSNLVEYLSLPNVVCVGGSWMVPNDLVAAEDWDGIAKISREAMDIVASR